LSRQAFRVFARTEIETGSFRSVWMPPFSPSILDPGIDERRNPSLIRETSGMFSAIFDS